MAPPPPSADATARTCSSSWLTGTPTMLERPSTNRTYWLHLRERQCVLSAIKLWRLRRACSGDCVEGFVARVS